MSGLWEGWLLGLPEGCCEFGNLFCCCGGERSWSQVENIQSPSPPMTPAPVSIVFWRIPQESTSPQRSWRVESFGEALTAPVDTNKSVRRSSLRILFIVYLKRSSSETSLRSKWVGDVKRKTERCACIPDLNTTIFHLLLFDHATGMTARLERAHAMAFQMLQGKTTGKYTLLVKYSRVHNSLTALWTTYICTIHTSMDIDRIIEVYGLEFRWAISFLTCRTEEYKPDGARLWDWSSSSSLWVKFEYLEGLFGAERIIPISYASIHYKLNY